MSEAVRQWPDNITAGPIRYERAGNYDGFCLQDVNHGIPTIGSVSPTSPVTIRGQHVRVFNYPGQTEEIARRLVACWNFFVGVPIEEVERRCRLQADAKRDNDLMDEIEASLEGDE